MPVRLKPAKMDVSFKTLIVVSQSLDHSPLSSWKDSFASVVRTRVL
jgi:hypothetical protein